MGYWVVVSVENMLQAELYVGNIFVHKFVLPPTTTRTQNAIKSRPPKPVRRFTKLVALPSVPLHEDKKQLCTTYAAPTAL